jgi:hypothetical protein
MPIYEYYCPDNNKIYQFFAKTIAQGLTVPKCPGNPRFRMRKIVSTFAVRSGGGKAEEAAGSPETAAGGAGAGDDPRMDAAMSEMEREFSSVDENDPRAMGRMMRRMTELTGEKMDGEMEEVVRKLEEGADPESLEDQLGGDEAGGDDPYGDGPAGAEAPKDPKEPRQKFRSKARPPVRDPGLYDYE